MFKYSFLTISKVNFNLNSCLTRAKINSILFKIILFTYHFQVVKVLILPRLKIESALMKQAQEGVDPVEKNAAENLKTLLLVRKDEVLLLLLFFFVMMKRVRSFSILMNCYLV